MCIYGKTATRLKVRFPSSSKNSSHAGVVQLLKQLAESNLLDLDALVAELDRRDLADMRRLFGGAGLNVFR